jgi:hypothetical protein
VFLNGVTIFDLTIGLLSCLISSIKGANYCLPISVAFSSLFNAYIWRNVISFVLYLTNNMCTLHLFVFKNHFFNYRKLSVVEKMIFKYKEV